MTFSRLRFLSFVAGLLFIFQGGQLFAQTATTDNSTAGSTINQVDAKKRRTGWWLLSEPARLGESAYTTFGRYEAGRRFGQWYTLNSDGDITAIENYRKDALDGEAKYFANGRLIMTGNFRGLNPDAKLDTINVVDPRSGDVSQVVVPSERGSLRHGLWRYYDEDNGQLRQEVEYQVDEVIFRKEYTPQVGDSAYVQRRIQALPHNRGKNYVPPPGKRSLSR